MMGNEAGESEEEKKQEERDIQEEKFKQSEDHAEAWKDASGEFGEVSRALWKRHLDFALSPAPCLASGIGESNPSRDSWIFFPQENQQINRSTA